MIQILSNEGKWKDTSYKSFEEMWMEGFMIFNHSEDIRVVIERWVKNGSLRIEIYRRNK